MPKIINQRYGINQHAMHYIATCPADELLMDIVATVTII